MTMEDDDDSDIIDLENVSPDDVSPLVPPPTIGTGLPTVITSMRERGEGGDST